MPLAAYSQSGESRVTLNMTNVSLSDVFREIKRQTNAQFIYSDNEIEKAGNVTVNVSNQTVGRTLEIILAGTPLKYELSGGNYIVSPRTAAAQQGQASQPARKTITGRVVNQQTGEPLIGATILYEEAFIGTTSDAAGNFKIEVPASCRELLVSYMGYDTQTVSVVGRTQITVSLAESSNVVEEVVVTGYFNVGKDSFTGAQTTVKREELRKYGNTNMLEALRLIDPSFKMKENNLAGSDPNALPEFFVRGESSFMGSSNIPTFIVDGNEVSLQKVFDMDMDRIESLTILKDASATILYGSRAANGVVVIETRRPEGGRFTVSYNNRTSLSIPDLSGYNLMNAREKLEFELKADILNMESMADLEYIEHVKQNIERGVDTDWMAQVTRTAASHSHALYLEGGSDNVIYGIGANYSRNAGVIKKSYREVFGASFDFTYRIPGKVNIRNSFDFGQTNVQNSPYGSFSQYTAANPYNAIRDENGDYIKQYTPHAYKRGEVEQSSPQYQNPIYNASLPYKDQQAITTITNNLNIDYYFSPELRLRGSAALTKGINTKDKYISPKHSSFLRLDTQPQLTPGEKGSYTQGQGNDFSYNINATLSYSLTRGKHVLFAGAGVEMVQNKTKYSQYTAYGFLDERFNEIWYGGFLSNTRPTGSEGMDRMIGVFANVNYAYDHRYFADFSARFDGSSKFGKDRQFAPFVSLGAGWNIHNEHFMESVDWLSQLRLRGSIGTTGNQNFEPYLARTTLEFDTDGAYWKGMGAHFMAYGNTKLEWQKTIKTNIGIDFEVLDRRLNLKLDYYNNKTNALLLPVAVTPSLGFTTYVENFGEQENKGYEFDLTAVIIRNKDIDWAVNLSGVHNTNKITKISEALRKLNDDNNSEKDANRKPIAMYEEGESINVIKVVRSLGINPASGKEIFLTRFGTVTEVWDYRDKIVAGCTDPDLEGNIGTNFMWKNFTLNMTLRYSFGGQVYNETLVDRVESAEPRANADRRALHERWQEPGDRTFYRGISERSSVNATSRFVQDNNYLEISNIALSYRVAADKLKRFGLTGLRVGLNTSNIGHLSTVKRERGLDYPFARTFTFSLNLTF